MRTSHSRVLNQARMVKEVLKLLHNLPADLPSLQLPDSRPEIARIEKITARLMVTRERIKSGKAERVVREPSK